MDEDWEIIAKGLTLLLVLFAIIFGLKGCLGMEAKQNAELYNKKFGTEYTEHQFFWAGSTIEKFHEEKVSERPKEYKVEIK